jgi:hypothetical protein
MADSVEGLAAQAEKLADDLLTKTTVLPKKGAASSTNAAAVKELPPPDEKGGLSPGVLIGGGIGGVLLSGVTLISGFIGWGASLGAESDLNFAKDNYIGQGTADREGREALVAAANAQENAAIVNNCVWVPLTWISLPLCIGGVGAIGWGAVDAATDDKKGGEE